MHYKCKYVRSVILALTATMPLGATGLKLPFRVSFFGGVEDPLKHLELLRADNLAVQCHPKKSGVD